MTDGIFTTSMDISVDAFLVGGGGGGGSEYYGCGTGGSGIVVIRNVR